MGVIAPIAVTTARRAGSWLGIGRIVATRTQGPGSSGGRRRPSVAVVALEDDRGVVAAEADVVRERVAHGRPDRLVDDPQVAGRVGVAVVERPGNALLGD